MKTLIYDLETNGMRPKVPYGQQVPPEKEPATIQIAAILFDGRRPTGHLSCFMKPLDGEGNPAAIPGIKPEIEALEKKEWNKTITSDEEQNLARLRESALFFSKHGLTEEVVANNGLDYQIGLAMFNNMVKLADRLVAHNIAFDWPVIRASYKRIGAPLTTLDATERFCTMHTLTDHMKLPGKFGKYKWPKLEECYRALVNPDGFSGAHDAMVDVMATAEVLWAAEDLELPLWKHA